MLFSKIKTVLKYSISSWKNSTYVVEQKPTTNRFLAWVDLIYWFVRYGHDFNDYCTFEFWEKTPEERKSYISLRRNDVLRFAFSTPRVHKLFLDKAVFNKHFKEFVSRGWITTEGHTFEELCQFTEKYSSVIAKPLDDFGGHGVFKIAIDKDNYQDNLERLKDFVNKGIRYIVEETIENAEYIKRLAPGSLNTLRIVTVIDKHKKLHIIAALLRMGNGKAITDNYHDGGMACPIDVETGKLKSTAYGMNNFSCDVHPYSGISFEGHEINDFKICCEMVRKIAFIEPEARYVGWDFAITPNGIELLEGNIPPGEDITQIATGCGMWYKMLEWK